ncbi:MAG: alpha-L-rhamnosidase, partial [Planctomycetota bacterium]
LQWINMMRDLVAYRGRAEQLRPYLPFAREVLEWFLVRRRADGLLGQIQYAPFVDWAPAFEAGNAPQDNDGGSAILTMMLAETCGHMAILEQACGYPELVGRWQIASQSLRAAAMTQCWNSDRKLLADTPSRRSYSVHAQVQAILAGTLTGSDATDALQRALDADDVVQPGTLYYRYYLVQAAKAAGRPELLFDLLEVWHGMLEGTGLTTWPESDRHPRSDCHAWSVTPAIELLQTVLGVQPAKYANGLDEIRFAPALGPLPGARGAIPTPHGTISVALARRQDGRVDAQIDTPVPFMVVGSDDKLPPGRHELVV